MSRLIFISSPYDMKDWRDLAANFIEEFKARHGLLDIEYLNVHSIDSAILNHAETYQEAIKSPSQLGAAMTIVLFGECIGLPLDKNFCFRDDIALRLSNAGIDWMNVNGVEQPDLKPDYVPLTGTLFEYFDGLLPSLDGTSPAPLRTFFRGTLQQDRSKPNFGNGKLLKEIAALPLSQKDRLAALERYIEQTQWLERFYDNCAGAPQRPLLFCKDDEAFLKKLESALRSVFIDTAYPFIKPQRRQRIDPLMVTLPSLSPFDVERANFYFGRDRQKRELVTRTVNTFTTGQGITALVGASGSGKSSLLRAGLMTQIQTESRCREGWRSAFISLSEKPSKQSPIIFLAEALTNSSALPEIGPVDILTERLSGMPPTKAADRLIEIVSAIHFPPQHRSTRMLLVVDQFELAIEGASGSKDDKMEWSAFISLMNTLSRSQPKKDGLVTPGTKSNVSPNCCPTSVVIGLPDHEILNRSIVEVAHTIVLPWLLDPMDVQQIVAETFNELGLSIDPAIIMEFRTEAEQSDFQAPILPLLSVALYSLHENWKTRQRGKTNATSIIPTQNEAADVVYNITFADFERCGRLRQAISRLGEAAFREAGSQWNEIAPASFARMDLADHNKTSGPTTVLDFAFGLLFRKLVAVSRDESTPDLLRPAVLNGIDTTLSPLVEVLVKHRLLARRGGEVWLVHRSVLRDWPRAALWRQSEAIANGIEQTIRIDLERWQKDQEDGYIDADRRLWTNVREIEDAFYLLSLRGLDFDTSVTDFIRAGSVFAAAQNINLAGMSLVMAAFFGSVQWAEELLHVCKDPKKACNWISMDSEATALHNAAIRGNVEFVALLLRSGSDPDLVAGNWTALHVAASNGHTEICQMLLNKGANPNAPGRNKRSPLHLAAQRGDFKTSRVLLRAGASAKPSDCRKLTALHFAAMSGNEELCRTLISADASIGDLDSDQNTPLHFAAIHGHVEVCKLLVAEGGDKDFRNRNGATPLDYAAALGLLDIVTYFMDINTSASTTDLTALIFEGASASLISRLLEQGALLNGLSYGIPPMISAVRARAHDIFWLLFNKGAQPSITAPGYITIMHAIAERNDWQLLDTLLERRVPLQLDEARTDGRTPLDICRIVGAVETERKLLEQGVQDSYFRDFNQDSLITKANATTDSLQNNQEAIYPPQLIFVWFNTHGFLIITYDGEFHEPPLHAAFDINRRVIYLDFENYIRREYYLLNINAMLHHYLAMAPDRALLQQQHHRELGSRQELPFYVLRTEAQINGYESKVQQQSQGNQLHGDEAPGLRLVAKASPRSDERPRISMSLLSATPPSDFGTGLSPSNLETAVEANDLELVMRFAKSESLDSASHGRTRLLHIAAANGYQEIVEFLISEEVGMRVDIPNDADQLPGDLAAANGHHKIVELMIANGAPEPYIWSCSRVSDEATFMTFTPAKNDEPWIRDMLKGCGNRLIIPFESMQLRSASLDFVLDVSLLAIEDTTRRGRREQFAIYRPNEDFLLLDWTNEPIYHFMSRHHYQINEKNVIPYAKFFFHFVRGYLGRFLIKEPGDDIPWKVEVTAEEIKFVQSKIASLTICDVTPDWFALDAFVLFRNALFTTKIGVARRYFEIPVHELGAENDFGKSNTRRPGELWLFDENLVREDLSIKVNGPPGIFG